MWYSIKKLKNIVTIKKESNEAVNVSLFVETPCESTGFKEIVVNQAVLTEYAFTLPLKDAVYKLTIFNGTTTVDVIIPFYDSLLTSLIDDIEMAICGCGCEGCNDCGEDDKTLANTLVKTMMYSVFVNPYYRKFFDAAFKCLRCTLEDANLCLVLNETIHGDSDNTILTKRMLAMYYLAFYFAELSTFTDTQETIKKFKFERLKRCIHNLGIDIQCIIDNLGEVNTPPIIGDNTIYIDNKATRVLNLADFTTNTTPPYFDAEGNALGAIKILALNLAPGATLKLAGTNVVVGQTITAQQIAQSALVYNSPLVDTQQISSFRWSAMDNSGSFIFVE